MLEAPARFFCSESSRARREQIFATAPAVDVWLLLEYHGRWGPDALPVNELPADVRGHLQKLTRAIPRSRLLLIRQGYLPRPGIQLFVVRSREQNPGAVRFELSCYQDLLELTAEGLLLAGQPHEAPLLLVCTHGKHDKCCAKFGFPLYRALRENADAQVWECSHVGGDRFAGNVIAMPHGAYYGHVCPADSGTLAEAQNAGSILLEKYRGRCCYGRTGQAGEYFIRSAAGLTGFDELRFRDAEAVAPEHWRVRFEGSGSVHEVEFRRLRSDLSGYFTCHADTPQPVSRFELLSYATA